MKKTLIRILAAVSLLSAVFNFTSCGEKKQKEVTIKEEIHYALNSSPASLDVHCMTVLVAKMVVEGTVFQKLIEIDENGNTVPMLAESYSVNDSNTEFTFKLRSGIKFHNGETMTADDVVASMNRWIEKDSGVKKVFGTSRFEKTGDLSVKVTTSKPNIFIIDTINYSMKYAAIMPKSVIDNCDPKTGYVKSYIGTGPYKFVEWIPDQYILIEKNEDYVQIQNGAKAGWAGEKKAPTKKLFFHFVADDSTRVAGIQTGEYDLIYKAPYEDYTMLNSNNKLTMFNAIYGDIWMVFNKREGVASNPLIRQAVQIALDNEEILMGAFATKDLFRLNGGYMLEEQKDWFNNEADSTYNKHDIEKAKALLKEAGYNGEEFTLLVTTDFSEHYNSALVIQQQLKAVGINCQLLTTDWATLGQYRMDPKKYSAFISTGPSPLLPSTVYYVAPTWAGWSDDAKFQNMMGEMNGAATIQEGVEMWKKIQKYCSEEYVPVCHLGDINRFSVGVEKIKDVELTRYGPALWNAYVEE